MHSVEHEWRVELDKPSWTRFLAEARALGACEGSAQVVDLVYGLAGFESVQKHGWIIRIRKNGSAVALEVKERLATDKWRETVTNVSDPKATAYMLRLLGVWPHLLLDRTRTIVRGTDHLLCFDEMVGLGYFIEVEELVERTTAGQDLADIVKQLRALPSRPPYGDIVKQKTLDDANFKEAYERLIKSYEEKHL